MTALIWSLLISREHSNCRGEIFLVPPPALAESPDMKILDTLRFFLARASQEILMNEAMPDIVPDNCCK
jgi:hypothetical protein